MVDDEAEGRMPLITVLSGSPSPSSRTRLLSAWVADWLGKKGFDIHALDVRDLPAADLFEAKLDGPEVKRAVQAVADAHGVVIATPVYKAAYPGVLKAFLDLLPQLGLTGKIVLPLAVGGSLAHVLAIDYAMRPILSSLNALHVTGGLFFLDKQLERTDEGGVRIDPGMEDKLKLLLQSFADSVRMRASETAAAG
jgi:FMN reductase